MNEIAKRKKVLLRAPVSPTSSLKSRPFMASYLVALTLLKLAAL